MNQIQILCIFLITDKAIRKHFRNMHLIQVPSLFVTPRYSSIAIRTIVADSSSN